MRAKSPADSAVLILGGARDGRMLADALAASIGPRALLSLAGATKTPAQTAARVRRGGFGGAEGLARFLVENRIAALVDATHPFASQMSRHAADAALQTGVPLLRLERPPWTPRPGERWRAVDSLEAAAEAPETGARVFLAIGPRRVAAFSKRRDLWCALRRIEPTEEPFPLAQGQWVVGPPAADMAEESRLFRSLTVEWLITKNSGGDRSKLDAAHALGLRTVMVERPAPVLGVETVASVAEALTWVRSQASGPA